MRQFDLQHFRAVSLCGAMAWLIALATVVQAQDYSALFERLDPTVVTIQTVEVVGGKQGISQQQGVGSGVLIDAKGLIMTAAHVVHAADRVFVKFVGGEVKRAQVVSSVPGGDVALLKVGSVPASATVAELDDSDGVKVGQEAIVIGAPLGIEHSLSIGHVSGKVTRSLVAGGVPLKLIQTDAAINKGNSGGPLFNTKGKVIGIVSHILSQGGGSDGIGFAVSINAAKRILLDSSPFWTGFEGEMLTPELARMLNVPQGSGLLVQRVLADSIAGKAGLRGGQFKVSILGRKIWIGGDVILEIHNIACTQPHNFDRIRKVLKGLEKGASVNIKVLRAGKVKELQLQL